MKQIKAIKNYKWKLNMPEFINKKSYNLADSMADEMVEHGYAEFCEQKNENKMIDLQSNTAVVKRKYNKKKK